MALILMFASGQFVNADAASDVTAAKKSKKSSGKSRKCGVRTVAVVTDLALPTDEDENDDVDLLPPDEGDDDEDLIDDDEELFGLADLVSERVSMRVKSKGLSCSRAVRVVRKYYADPSRRASKRYNGFKCTEADLDVTCKRGRKRVSAVED